MSRIQPETGTDKRAERPLMFPEASSEPARSPTGKKPAPAGRRARALLTVGSLGAMGAGAWFFHPGVALLLVGGLVWLDLQLWSVFDLLGPARREKNDRRAAQ